MHMIICIRSLITGHISTVDAFSSAVELFMKRKSYERAIRFIKRSDIYIWTHDHT